MTNAMGPDVLIPLVSVVVYVPLLVILLINRPWDRRQKLFLSFLTTAAVWSFATFLSRSGFLIQDRVLEAKIIFGLFVLMLVQFHYFVSSFYRSDGVRFPLVYLFVLASIILTSVGLIPRGAEPLDYGP